MLGFQLLKECISRDLDVFATVRNPDKLPSEITIKNEGRLYRLDDATDWNQLERCLQTIQPEFVVNCIGIVKQSNLAKDPVASITVNSLLPHKLHNYGSEYGFRVIQISTDCVFRGDKGMYKESDFPDALDLYGRSKMLGEIDAKGAITLRTSIIGHELGSSANGLLEWFLSANDKVEGYHEAIFSGLTTNELSNVILDKVILSELEDGLYHVAAEPINKYDLLKLIANIYGKEIIIKPSNRVKINRSLNGDKFSNATGYRVPGWEKMIGDMNNG